MPCNHTGPYTVPGQVSDGALSCERVSRITSQFHFTGFALLAYVLALTKAGSDMVRFYLLDRCRRDFPYLNYLSARQLQGTEDLSEQSSSCKESLSTASDTA